MTTYANWLELDRSPHAIQFYSNDNFVLDSLGRFVRTALEAGDSCLVLATVVHLDGLAKRLKAQGVNTDTAVKKGRYVTIDVLQVLARITVNGNLDKILFNQFINDVAMPLKAAAESKPPRVAVGGEAVSVLWTEGKPEAAIELERLWNGVATDDSFFLRCFYPVLSFSDPVINELFLKLCAEHATVIPNERQLRNLGKSVEEFELSIGLK